MNNMGKVCEKIGQGLPVEAGAFYTVTVIFEWEVHQKLAGVYMGIGSRGLFRLKRPDQAKLQRTELRGYR